MTAVATISREIWRTLHYVLSWIMILVFFWAVRHRLALIFFSLVLGIVGALSWLSFVAGGGTQAVSYEIRFAFFFEGLRNLGLLFTGIYLVTTIVNFLGGESLFGVIDAIFMSKGDKIFGIPLFTRWVLFWLFYIPIFRLLSESPIPFWVQIFEGSFSRLILALIAGIFTSFIIGVTYRDETKTFHQTMFLTAISLILLQSIFGVDLLRLNVPIPHIVK